jgi:hypothetical protein
MHSFATELFISASGQLLNNVPLLEALFVWGMIGFCSTQNISFN